MKMLIQCNHLGTQKNALVTIFFFLNIKPILSRQVYEIILGKSSSTKTTKPFFLNLSDITRFTKNMKTTIYDRLLWLLKTYHTVIKIITRYFLEDFFEKLLVYFICGSLYLDLFVIGI